MRSDRPPEDKSLAARTALRPPPRRENGIGPMLSLRLQVSCTLRLAHPADSLVRVSRRVGRATASLSRGTPSRRPAPGTNGCDPRPREESRFQGEPKDQKPRIQPGVTSDGNLADVAPKGCNTTTPEDAAATFPPTLSSRSIHPDAARTRREVHRQPAGRPRRPGLPRKRASDHQGLPTGRRLNPAAARLAGPTVFSLNGFTCS